MRADDRSRNQIVVASIDCDRGVAAQPKVRSNLPLSTTHVRSDW